MNHIYRLVWNKKRHMLMAVAEVASAQGKDGTVKAGCGGIVSEESERFPGVRKNLAAALMAVFPLVSFAQMTVPSDYIPVGTTEYLLDSDGSNGYMTGMQMHVDGRLDISGTAAGTNLSSLAGSGSVLMGGQSLTLSSAYNQFDGVIDGAGGLTIGGGNETLGGTNTYTGTTAINWNSALSLTGSGGVASSQGVVNNGVFDISATNGGARVQSLSGSGSVLLGGQTLTLTNAGDMFAGTLGGSGGLAIGGGTAYLGGTNTHTGATAIGWDASLVLTGSGSIALSSGLHNDGMLYVSDTDAGAQLQSLSGSGGVWLGAQSLILTDASDTFAGKIDGYGGLNVASGTEVLSGRNTYSGMTSIGDQGTLRLSGAGGIESSAGLVNDGVFDISATEGDTWLHRLSGSGTVLLGGQTLVLSEGGDEFAGVISGSGGVWLAGDEVLSGTNTYTGTTAIDEWSRLSLSGSGSIALSSSVIDNGTFDISATNAGAQIQSLSGSGTVVLGGQTLTLTNAHDVFSGQIIGQGGLAVTGGNQALSVAQDYTGMTTIGNNGGLWLSGSGGIALSSGLVDDGIFSIAGVDNGASVQALSGSGAVLLGGQTLTLAQADGVFAGVISGSGGLAISAGAEALGGANTYGGATTIARGAQLSLGGSGSIALSSGVDNDGIFSIAATNAGASVLSLSGSGTVLLGGQTLTLTNAHDTFAGVIKGSGGLAIGSGSEVLSNNQMYTGVTAIGRNGSLSLAGSAGIALSSGLVDNGVFDIAATNAGASVQSLSGSGTVLLGGQTLTLTNAQGTFAGVIKGSGGLAIGSGSEVLSNNQMYTGATTIGRNGSLSLGGSGSIALSSGVDNDGIFSIAATNAGASVQSLSGSGTVLLGGQTLTLTNAHDTFAGVIKGSGGLAINSGSEVLSNNQMYTGVTAIGRNGSLSLAGSAGIALSSGLVDNGVFDIAATSAGASVQSLSGSGILQLGGQTLTLTNARDTFAGVISGVGGLALSSGNETLSGTNTYTGATTIGRNGSLSLSGAGAIALSSRVEDDGVFDIAATTNGAKVQSLSGAGAVLLGGQTLTLTNAHDTFAGGIRGSGGLAIAAGNAMLTGANGGFTGTTTVAAGALLALSGAGSIAGSALRDDGVFDVTAATASNVGLKSLSGSGSVLLGSHDLTLSQAGGNFSGTIAGSGNLRVTGGKLVLGGTNTYAGKTIVSGATLQTTAAANLGSGSSALELDNGTWQTSATLTHERGLLLSGKGTVDVDAATVTTENGAVTGAGKLVKQGTGTLVLRGVLGNGGGVQVDKGMLTLTAANTYSGDTTVATGGVLRIDSDANLGAAGNKLTLDGGMLQTTTTMASARAVTLTEKTGTFDTEGASSVVTLDGNITGAGRLVKEGAGTLVLAGDNAGGQGSANKPGDGWTGGLTINDGLVKVTNAYGLGWGSVLTFNSGTIYAAVDIATGQNIRMGNSTSIDTAAGTVTTLAGDMLSTGAGNGCFTKTGLGTLNVTGAANIDSTCVMQGKLLANGYFSSKVTVAQGATLGGSGTVKGDVLVQGTLSPGNSPGMLTADSNITMAKGSTYKEDIGGSVQASGTSPVGAPGYYSYLNVVNGKRFVIEQGATLAPTLKGLYSVNEPGYGSAPVVPQLGQTYRIVTADGGVVGRFDTLVQPEGQDGTRFAAFYNLGGSKSIELKVLPASYATWLKDGNAGSRSAAAALDRIADLDQSGQGSERQAALLYQAASYDAAKLGGLVQGLSGQVHGALAAATPQAGWDLQRSVLKHGSDTNGRALWLDITGSRGKWSSDGGAAGFHADRVQVTAGVDVYASRDAHLGFGASHATTDLSPEGGSGKLRQNKVLVYGDTAINGMVFDAIGAYGRDKGDTSRSDPFLTPGAALHTAADGHSTLLGAGVRTEREFGGTKIEPFARVNVQKVERDGASEGSVSSAALELAGYSATGTRLVAGLSAASRNSDPLQGSTYRFNLGAGVDTGSLVRANQQASLAGVTMTVAAPDVGRAFLQGSVTGTLQLKKGAYLYLGVTGEARNGYYQLGGNAGVRAVF